MKPRFHTVIAKHASLAPWLADDVRSEAEWFVLRRPGGTPDALDRHLNAFVASSRRHEARGHDLDTGKPVEPVTPRRLLTEKQKVRFLRDLIIQMAHRAGISQRRIADVFRLPRSRIADIVKKDLKAQLTGEGKACNSG